METDQAQVPRSAKMQPCCMAVSSEVSLGFGNESHLAFRRWRALSLDNQAQLAVGRLVTNADDPLAIVRDKAIATIRKQGYEPQRFILENTGSQ